MTQSGTALRFRLSAGQMSVIWPGLDLLIKSYIAQNTKGGRRYEYPFRMFPPPFGFYRGVFSQEHMDQILAIGKLLGPRSKTGGRVRMDTIELRASIFAIRAHLGFVRMLRRPSLGGRSQKKTNKSIDDASYAQLQTRSQRVILSLERHMKRANRILSKSITKEQFKLRMQAWTAHLHWMSLHIAYFKAWPGKSFGRKTLQQAIIDQLTKMAEQGIRKAGYQVPEPPQLRRMMRLYASSARRFREGKYSIQFMMAHPGSYETTCYLAEFVFRRLELKELSNS